jgi:glutathione S-transferase
MIRLYHCVGARSFRPLWTMEELGVPYALTVLPFPPRERQPSYLELNPLGTIPLFVDGQTRMTESVAICQYLCARNAPSPLAVGPGEPGFGAWLNFLHFGEATLTFPQTLVLRYSRFEPRERRLPQAAEDYAKWFHARLRTLEPLLSANQYLCAGRFTAADISVGYALLLATDAGLASRFKPAVAAYWARLQERPGYRRARAAEREAALAQGVSPEPGASMVNDPPT